MATIPSQHPSLTLHLTDASLTPIISSASSSPTNDDFPAKQHQQHRLTYLASTCLATHNTAARLLLGTAQRSMLEYDDGSVVLFSYLSPMSHAHHQAQAQTLLPVNGDDGGGSGPSDPAPHAGGKDSSGIIIHQQQAEPQDEQADQAAEKAPTFLALVIAPGRGELADARRALGKLERLARTLQREWSKEVQVGAAGCSGVSGR